MFDKNYVDKELEKKGIDAFGVFHIGPESSALATAILPYYVSLGIVIPTLGDCVASELADIKKYPTYIRMKPSTYFNGKLAAIFAYK